MKCIEVISVKSIFFMKCSIKTFLLKCIRLNHYLSTSSCRYGSGGKKKSFSIILFNAPGSPVLIIQSIKPKYNLSSNYFLMQWNYLWIQSWAFWLSVISIILCPKSTRQFTEMYGQLYSRLCREETLGKQTSVMPWNNNRVKWFDDYYDKNCQ